jgi:hypothetical protein
MGYWLVWMERWGVLEVMCVLLLFLFRSCLKMAWYVSWTA